MHDLLLRDGTGHDGLGGPPRRADAAIADVRPTGVEHVFLAGRQVIADGEFTGDRHGRMLRRGAR
ncbi:hypothetical protein ABZ297_06450 [Nonomuraea sp. NPDC005983]|uniref:hypothetical protein n=1 Tax=Nonomuraea sp. NPDC005983 TaxID=3155595 RepID=UPI0033B03A5D